MDWLYRRALRQVDVAALAAFRILFGALLLASVLRFWAQGWVDEFFVQRTFFFKFLGFEFVSVPGPTGLYTLVAVQAICALLFTLGLAYRLAAFGFLFSFGWMELMDVTNYLNHYYLVSVLTLLMAFLPANAAFSLDARFRAGVRRSSVPAWMLWLLRVQVGLVYFYASVAKMNADWLLHAQPLIIWLSARTDIR